MGKEYMIRNIEATSISDAKKKVLSKLKFGSIKCVDTKTNTPKYNNNPFNNIFDMFN